jgi:tRNA A37 threonylcarbamoyladenosine synthetase subunit TsaC/SUA5/YrdC
MVLLVQTDTTVGLLSDDADTLSRIKKRPKSKPFLKVYSSFQKFRADARRVPSRYKNFVRRAKKTTFILKNNAWRIVKEERHRSIIKYSSWLYSTSANESGMHFERNFCMQNSDIVIEDFKGLFEASPSKLYKMGKKRLLKMR